MAEHQWIDFKELRKQVDFRKLLHFYRVAYHEKGDQATAFCPLPGHDGQKKTRSFSANLSRGVWRCFGCGASGNCLDFAILMDKRDPERAHDVRETALKLAHLFGVSTSPAVRPPRGSSADNGAARVKGGGRRRDRRDSNAGSGGAHDDPQRDQAPPALDPSKVHYAVNAPLDFELKTIDPRHRYLFERGFTAATIAYFGLGFCSRGMLRDRIAIPLHDRDERLIGYAGRVTDDRVISDEHTKYRFPGKRIHDGVVYEFRKQLFVYNANRIRDPVDDLVVVQGFPATWWCHQHDIRDVVALMGWACSAEQAEIIVDLVRSNGSIWLLSDGDDLGVRCAESVLPQVAAHRSVRWARLSGGHQPTDVSGDELFGLLPWAAHEKSGSPVDPPAAAPGKKSSEKVVAQTAANCG